MSIATLTTKGQITIPVDVRRVLDVEGRGRGEFAKIEPGRFGRPRRAASIEEMNAAIAAQATRTG